MKNPRPTTPSTPPATATRTRPGALLLAATGILFVLYPALRPWEDESTLAGAIAALGSTAWVASHLFAMIGFILLPLGLLALRRAVAGTPGERPAVAGLLTAWIGAGLVLPYYGAEDFGLNAIAREAAEGQRFDLLAVVETVRFSPVAATTFGIGLLALAVGAVLAGVAVWRSGTLTRYSGIPFALGFALFLPQFFTPAPVRITHGVLVGIGSAWLARELWRTETRQPAQLS
ncbi:hypothetical protein GCM10022225_20780 [Plantactinospora mayteni]|uniref:DUF4386 family protein n=1 Tax=Plantactinospora mayteni TaxID=566021 RepID=A0ABQ4ENP7_9ACTN|nr:hypothetical protein [Plantactinospora mayteni]GIG96259.1 hypothetical protein Pma05_28320 [Plantactinospora mayteni]